MKRFIVADMTGTGTGDDPFRPAVPGEATGFVLLTQLGGKCMVQVEVPDGTAASLTTLADVGSDGNVETRTLSNAAKTRIKNWLIAKGFNDKAALFDALDGDEAVTTAKKLLRFLAHHVFSEQVVVERLKNEFGVD